MAPKINILSGAAQIINDDGGRLEWLLTCSLISHQCYREGFMLWNTARCRDRIFVCVCVYYGGRIGLWDVIL